MDTLGKFLIGGLVGGLLMGHHKKKDPAPQQPVLAPVTRDTVREDAERRDELRRRRGGAADIVTGALGGEPLAPTGKATLGS